MSEKMFGSIGLAIDESIPDGFFVTGPTTEDAANSIKRVLTSPGGAEALSAVLVTRDALLGSPQVGRWCSMAERRAPLAILGDLAGTPFEGSFTSLSLPSTLRDVSDALGAQPRDGSQSINITATGRVEFTPIEPSLPDDSDWGIEDASGDAQDTDLGDTDADWFGGTTSGDEDLPDTYYTTGPRMETGGYTGESLQDNQGFTEVEDMQGSEPGSRPTTDSNPIDLAIEPTKPSVDLRKITNSHDELMLSSSSLRRANSHRLGAIVYVMGASGGLGKTTMSVSLAQRATDRSRELAEPLRVCLVDANPGQPDTIQRLFVHNGGFVSLGQSAIMRDYASVINSASSMSEIRSARNLHPIDFDYVTPDGDTRMSEKEVVSTYRALLEELRGQYDIVVVDIKTAEGGESNHIVEGVVKPTLTGRGAYAVFMTRDSNSTNNLTGQSVKFLDIGVPRERILSVLNDMRVTGDDSAKIRERIPQVLGKTSTFMGELAANAKIADNGPRGVVNQLPDDWKDVADKILYHVLGLEVPPQEDTSGRGFFSKLFGRSKPRKASS